MADRGATPAFLAELLKSTNSPCFLVDLSFDSGTSRLTNAWRSIVWNANTYVASGHFLGFTGLEETAELQVTNLTLTVSGVDQAYVSLALQEKFLDRRLVIYKAFMDYQQAIVSNPVMIFDGRMDAMGVTDTPGEKCAVSISATSHWGDFDRKAGRHTNNTEQQVWFPGDRFFEYCSQINKQIKWGTT